MQHVQCVAVLRSGERIGAELVRRPDGSVAVRIGNAAIKPEYIEVIRVPHDCPVDVLDEAILSGYYVLGAAQPIGW